MQQRNPPSNFPPIITVKLEFFFSVFTQGDQTIKQNNALEITSGSGFPYETIN